MAAPKNNQFWKLRNKHGREKLFASSQLLWVAATEYFQWCDNHPWEKVEQAKLAARPHVDDKGKVTFPDSIIRMPTQRPYTLTGLCLYLDCNTGYFRDFKGKATQDFSSVITRIEETIYTQKFEGAAVGAFNANIIARDLGLREKVDANNTNYNYNYTEMTPEEVKKYNEILESEV